MEAKAKVDDRDVYRSARCCQSKPVRHNAPWLWIGVQFWLCRNFGGVGSIRRR